MNNLILSIVLSGLTNPFSQAQTLTIRDSLLLNSTISSFSVDLQDQVYIGLQNGTLMQVTDQLEIIKQFSIPDFGSVSFIDARNSLRPFFFSRDQQEFLFLERFGSSPTRYKTRDFTSDYVSHAATGQDNSIWILETAGMELRKYDLTTRSVILTVPLNRLYKIRNTSSVFTHRNSLMILADNYLWKLDGFGNLITKIEIQSKTQPALVRDVLVGRDSGGYYQVDLKTMKKEAFSGPPQYNCAINVGKRFLFLGERRIDVYMDLR